MINQTANWAADYMEETAASPDYVALTAQEAHSLRRSLEPIFHASGPITVFGMKIEIVADDYRGKRVWRSKPNEPLKKASNCGDCGAPWLPECNYCGRVG